MFLWFIWQRKKKESCVFRRETTSVYVTGEPLAAQADTLWHKHRHRWRVSHLATVSSEKTRVFSPASSGRPFEFRVVVMFNIRRKHQFCSFCVMQSTAHARTHTNTHDRAFSQSLELYSVWQIPPLFLLIRRTCFYPARLFLSWSLGWKGVLK